MVQLRSYQETLLRLVPLAADPKATQVADLQTLGWLCRAQVIIPSPEQNIIGGTVDRTGDYTETGIEQANQDRPDVMTAGVLEFWQKHAGDRPTIAYAVSVDHAYHLIAVFNGAGIPAAVILGDSNREDRDNAIAGFKDGAIKVLVNVLVATEGFDLPDASCIIITRPTMSLALYLQMAGRGLRPKEDGGDCRILDLAYNAVTHGLPEDYREWSLEPSGSQKSGVAPVIRCPQCESVSIINAGNAATSSGRNQFVLQIANIFVPVVLRCRCHGIDLPRGHPENYSFLLVYRCSDLPTIQHQEASIAACPVRLLPSMNG